MNSVGHIVRWDTGMFGDIPVSGRLSPSWASEVLLREKATMTRHVLSNFEGINITLPETVDIISGKVPENISVEDALKVKTCAHGIDVIANLVNDEEFIFSKRIAVGIHSVTSEYEVETSQRGYFRSRNVLLSGVEYVPPESFVLDELWKAGEKVIGDIHHPVERACAAFLWMSRTQFFMIAIKEQL